MPFAGHPTIGAAQFLVELGTSPAANRECALSLKRARARCRWKSRAMTHGKFHLAHDCAIPGSRTECHRAAGPRRDPWPRRDEFRRRTRCGGRVVGGRALSCARRSVTARCSGARRADAGALAGNAGDSWAKDVLLSVTRRRRTPVCAPVCSPGSALRKTRRPVAPPRRLPVTFGSMNGAPGPVDYRARGRNGTDRATRIWTL